MFLLVRTVLLILLGLIVLRMADVELDFSEVPETVDKAVNSKFVKYFTKGTGVKEWFVSAKESIRPWGEFANTTNFRAPQNFQRLMKRAVNNLKYFQGNYIVISVILMAYCLLTSPLLLISIFASLIACYMLSLRQAEKKLVLAGRDIPLQQQYTAVGICSLPLYWWAGVGQAVFWILGATCFVTSLHAGLYNIEAIIRDEDQLEVLLNEVFLI